VIAAACLLIGASDAGHAAAAPTDSVSVQFDGAPASKVVKYYQSLIGCEFVIASNANPLPQTSVAIRLQEQPLKESLAALRRALFLQAGIAIAPIDDKRTSVSVNDAWLKLGEVAGKAGTETSKRPNDKEVPVLNLLNFPVRNGLDFYKALAGVEFIVAPDAAAVQGTIFAEGSDLSRDEAADLVRRALLRHAGVVLTPIDGRRVSVTYNDAVLRVMGASREPITQPGAATVKSPAK